MNATRSTEAAAPARSARVIGTIVKIWIPIVAFFYLWQANYGRGIFAYLTDRQFALLGRSYPVVTLMLLAAITVGPPIAAFLIWRSSHQAPKEERPPEAIIARALQFRNWMLVLTATLIGVGLLVLVVALSRGHGADNPVMVAATDATPVKADKFAATLSGYAVRSRALGYTQSVGPADYTVLFVPISSGSNGVPAYRYLVQLPLKDNPAMTPDAQGNFTGVLVRNALPEPILRLFQERGLIITDPYYVLYTDHDWNRLPLLLFAAHMFVAGIVAGVITFFQHRQLKRQREEAEAAAAVAAITAETAI